LNGSENLAKVGFCERPETADHLARAYSIAHDAREHIPRLVKIGLVAVQPAQTGGAIGHNTGQGLVDLMGNGGGLARPSSSAAPRVLLYLKL
jgi:hypothetical protein